MGPAEVELFPWVPEVLRDLTKAGFGLAIATNQPAWAKGKTSRAALEAAHEQVVREAGALGGTILSSHICYHRAEDGCGCRKPATGLLVEIFARHPGYDPARSWMAGDRAPDILAGDAYGLRTALIGPPAAEEDAVLAARAVRPSFRGRDLRDFARFLLASRSP
jgi:D-glycero-D-manno-heptose 1,7-bisphosphate phosphatase